MNEKVKELKETQMSEPIMPQKPASVAQVELADNLTAVINNASLPSFIVESVLKDLYNQVRSLARQQYEQDKKQYEQAMKEYEAQAAKKK